jgi:hypothetical protein
VVGQHLLELLNGNGRLVDQIQFLVQLHQQVEEERWNICPNTTSQGQMEKVVDQEEVEAFNGNFAGQIFLEVQVIPLL